MQSQFFNNQKNNLENFQESIKHLPGELKMLLDAIIINPWDTSLGIINLLKDNYVEQLKLLLPLIPQDSQALHDAIASYIKNNDLANLRLLHSLGINFEQSTWVNPPLLLSVLTGNVETFKFVSSCCKNLNVTTPDGKTAMHLAYRFGHKDIIQKLSADPRTNNQLTIKDFYGETPLDTTIKKFDISQEKVNNKLRDFLYIEIKKEPEKYLPPTQLIDYKSCTDSKEKTKYINAYIDNKLGTEGHCNGYAFLYGYYYALTGSSDEYYNILNSIVSWDGSESSLMEKVSYTKHSYQDRRDLFNQFMNDILWFYHAGEDVKEAMLYFFGDIGEFFGRQIHNFDRQRNRVFQYYTAKNKQSRLNLTTLFDLKTEKINLLQLEELLEYLSSFRNIYVDIAGSTHANTLYVDKHGLLNFYDPNATKKLLPFPDIKRLAKFIYAFKYYYLEELYKGKMHVDIRVFTYSDTLKPNNWQLQGNIKGTENKFNEAHICVLKNDYSSLEELIKNKPDLFNQPDFHGLTPLERAITMNANQCTAVMLKHQITTALDQIKLAGLCYAHNNLETFKKLINLFQYDFVQLFSMAQFEHWSSHLTDFLTTAHSTKVFRLEEVRYQEIFDRKENLLTTAVRRNDMILFKLLIENGVDITAMTNDQILLEKAMLMTSIIKPTNAKNNP